MKDGRIAARLRARFLAALAQTGQVREALRRSGAKKGWAYDQRRVDAGFARDWAVALEAGTAAVDAHARSGAGPDDGACAFWSGPGGRSKLVRIAKTGARWSEDRQAVFLEHLAATANVRASAAKAGFSAITIYRQRMKDAAFRALWEEALDAGVARVDMLLIDMAGRSLEAAPIPDEAQLPRMSVAEAITVVRMHKAAARGGAGQLTRRNWRIKPSDPEAAKAGILRKVRAIRAARDADHG